VNTCRVPCEARFASLFLFRVAKVRSKSSSFQAPAQLFFEAPSSQSLAGSRFEPGCKGSKPSRPGASSSSIFFSLLFLACPLQSETEGKDRNHPAFVSSPAATFFAAGLAGSLPTETGCKGNKPGFEKSRSLTEKLFQNLLI
jgi:hypothetical protein